LAACPLSGGLGNRVRAVLSIDTHESSKLSNRGASLNRAVKETPGVKGEYEEFEWLREANALNLHG
jgi:hypothetical protein